MRAWTGRVLFGVSVVSLSVAACAAAPRRNVVPLRPAAASLSPPAITVVSTGSGRIAVYWTAVQGATEYRVFRGTRAGRVDMRRPVNLGQAPRRSFEGSDWFLFVDTDGRRGLRNGREYFYQVQAIGPNGRSLSRVESDLVDPGGTPWDTRNPRLIIESIIRAAQPDEGDPLQGGITVAGPDNYLYMYDAASRRYFGRPNPWVVTGNMADNRETGESIALSGEGGRVIIP